ncbi:MAG: hypothetical protein AAF349_00365 [Cyanobacteria bacterium P01_A01_bin.68]
MLLVFGPDWGFIPWAHNCYDVYRFTPEKYLLTVDGNRNFLNKKLDEEEYCEVFNQIEMEERHCLNFQGCLNNEIIIKGFSTNLYTANEIEEILECFSSWTETEIVEKKIMVMAYNPFDLSPLEQASDNAILYFDLYNNIS